MVSLKTKSCSSSILAGLLFLFLIQQAPVTNAQDDDEVHMGACSEVPSPRDGGRRYVAEPGTVLIRNTRQTNDSGSDSEGDMVHTVEYFCDSGYTLTDGDAVRTCQEESGEWDGAEPKCEKKPPEDDDSLYIALLVVLGVIILFLVTLILVQAGVLDNSPTKKPGKNYGKAKFKSNNKKDDKDNKPAGTGENADGKTTGDKKEAVETAIESKKNQPQQSEAPTSEAQDDAPPIAFYPEDSVREGGETGYSELTSVGYAGSGSSNVDGYEEDDEGEDSDAMKHI